MAKLFDAEGKEVEALTNEEFEAKKTEILKEAGDGFATKEADFQKQINDLGEQLKEAGLSDAQKKRLKDDKTAAEEALKGVTEKFTKDMDDLKASIFGGQRNKAINALSSDKETRDKIGAKVDSLMKTGDYENTEEGMSKAIADAATIVTGSRPQAGFMDGVSGAGDRGNIQQNNAGGPESEASKAQRKNLGITDEDVTKFTPKQS